MRQSFPNTYKSKNIPGGAEGAKISNTTILFTTSADNPDIICIRKALPKHTHLRINEFELKVHDYDCFSNANY